MRADIERIKKLYRAKVNDVSGKEISEAEPLELYKGAALLLRDIITSKWLETKKNYRVENPKQVYYFSIEFLTGRFLTANLANTGYYSLFSEALAELGISLEDIAAEEDDPGLGNGGLGRLAACYMDSMATLGIPGNGNGILYRHGLFQQKILDGYQVEIPDQWQKEGFLWGVPKHNKSVSVKFGGEVTTVFEKGKWVFRHENPESVLAIPVDVPVCGRDGEINTLRLWSSEADQCDFDLNYFNKGDYLKAVEERAKAEAITEVLYPEDSSYAGKVLRLKQQYFFVSAGVQTIIDYFRRKELPWEKFPEQVALHLNDTHPVLVIPEIMRILMDDEGLGWDEAWSITTKSVFYTNHTILPEALEKWEKSLFREILPRIYMIVEEIDRRFREELRSFSCYSIDIEERTAILVNNHINMANLAVCGSGSVNGVSKIHTDILKKEVFHDFHVCFPYKLQNVTNGVSHRRFLLGANPLLAEGISRMIGDGWIKEPKKLLKLTEHCNDPNCDEVLMAINRANKQRLCKYIRDYNGEEIDSHTMFDFQVKRIHAYKRQLLNVFRIMNLYRRLKENPDMEIFPRTFLFAGKAAPGYGYAKQVIKLIHSVISVVNRDPDVNKKIKIVFLPEFNVTLAEMLFPAADVHEQISTAGFEASGTGNMKFMMNGAIMVGTHDGANMEIAEEAGSENVFMFGLKESEISRHRFNGTYSAREIYARDDRIRFIVDSLKNGFWGKADFDMIYNSIMGENDYFFVLKDFASFVETHDSLDRVFKDKKRWYGMSLNNIAHSGYFSSDRAIREYGEKIWKTRAVERRQ